MAHDVFISYCSEDKVVADAVCATLELHRIRCWIAPRDIRPGEDWGGAVIEGISHARVMVLVFSGHANHSPQVLREVERAVHRGLVIIPLRIEAAVPERSLEFFLSSPHWLDALDPPLAKYLDYLAEAIHSVLAQPGKTGSGEASAPAAPELGATRLLPPPFASEDPSPTPVSAATPPAPPPEAPVTGDPPRPPRPSPRRSLVGGGVVLAVILIAVIAGRGCSSSSKVATSVTTASTIAPTTSTSTPATSTTATTTLPTTPLVAPACSAACRALESAVPFDVSQCTPRPDSDLQQYLAVAGVDCVDPSNASIVVHALSFDTVDSLTNKYNFNVKDWGLVASTTCDISIGSCEGPWHVVGTTDSPGRVFALYDTKNKTQWVEWSDTRSLRLIWVTMAAPQPDYPKGNNLFFNWCTSPTCRSAWV